MNTPALPKCELPWLENISTEFDRVSSLLMDLSHCNREISASGLLIVALSLQETCDVLRDKLSKMNGSAA